MKILFKLFPLRNCRPKPPGRASWYFSGNDTERPNPLRRYCGTSENEGILDFIRLCKSPVANDNQHWASFTSISSSFNLWITGPNLKFTPRITRNPATKVETALIFSRHKKNSSDLVIRTNFRITFEDTIGFNLVWKHFLILLICNFFLLFVSLLKNSITNDSKTFEGEDIFVATGFDANGLFWTSKSQDIDAILDLFDQLQYACSILTIFKPKKPRMASIF